MKKINSKQTAVDAINQAVALVRKDTYRGAISHVSIYTNAEGLLAPQSEEIAVAIFSPEQLIKVKDEALKHPDSLVMVKVKR